METTPVKLRVVPFIKRGQTGNKTELFLIQETGSDKYFRWGYTERESAIKVAQIISKDWQADEDLRINFTASPYRVRKTTVEL